MKGFPKFCLTKLTFLRQTSSNFDFNSNVVSLIEAIEFGKVFF